MCLSVAGSRDILNQTSLHTTDWQVEVRKQTAGFSEVRGRDHAEEAESVGACVAELGERDSLEQGLKCWPLASRNPTPVCVTGCISIKKRSMEK